MFRHRRAPLAGCLLLYYVTSLAYGEVGHDCKFDHFMLEDWLPSNNTGKWLSFDEIQAAMDSLPHTVEVVQLTAGKLPCRQKGCCDINFLARRLAHGSTDWHVVRETVVYGGYGFLYEDQGLDPKCILDAGANIGMASIILAHWFPKAKIVAVEPSSENFRMLVANTQKYGNIYPENAGLWKKFGTLDFSADPQAKEHWGFRVQEGAPGSRLQAVTIQDLLEKHGCQGFEYVKLDIEGAEVEVITEGPLQWLDAAQLVSIEIHKWVDKARLMEVMQRHPFAASEFTEYTLFRRAAQSTHLLHHLRRMVRPRAAAAASGPSGH